MEVFRRTACHVVDLIACVMCDVRPPLKLRFVAVQKLREKKLVTEDGTLEIVTKITREQTSKNVSFNTHAREQDGEDLAGQVRKL